MRSNRLLALALLPSLAASVHAAEPASPIALWTAAETAEKAGDHRAAASGFDEAARALPGHPAPALHAARAYLALGEEKSATERMERALTVGTVLAEDDILRTLPPGSWSAGSAANADAISPSSVERVVPDRTLIAESIAFDPTDGSIYVGSLYHRKVLRVDRQGRSSDFILSGRDQLQQVLGIKIHPSRRELWVNSCDTGGRPPMVGSDPERRGTAAVFRYDRADGRLIRKYEAADAPADLCFNDLAFANEYVYLTAGAHGVFRVTPDAPVVERLVAPSGHSFNGIASSPDGQRIYLADGLAGIVLLDPVAATLKTLAAKTPVALAGIDGLYVHRGSLIGIQNGLTRWIPNRVVRARLGVDGRVIESVEVLERNHPLYDWPTTGAIAGDDLLYIANSQLRSFDETNSILPEGRLHPTYILRLDLDLGGGVHPVAPPR